jgi:hypothetical protein
LRQNSQKPLLTRRDFLGGNAHRFRRRIAANIAKLPELLRKPEDK